MAIGFARLEFVKRSSGKNACAKAAYNSRSEVRFHGNEFQPAQTYDWSSKAKPLYHEVILPANVDQTLLSPEALWNLAEAKENRKNSVIANEIVLALPDDAVISNEDRVHLAKTFIREHFTSKGFAVQLDIHQPDAKEVFSEETGKYEKMDHNFHAHILTTTRRFKENGKELEDNKPREYITALRQGKVISGPNWGKLWSEHQNLYFEEKGLSLRVDPNGLIPQNHLGPTRMRGRAFSLLYENSNISNLNVLELQEPDKILSKLTETKSVFTAADLDSFLQKHALPIESEEIKAKFWGQKEIVQLLDKETNTPQPKFTSQTVIEEEQKIMRLAERIGEKNAYLCKKQPSKELISNLTTEQQKAFDALVSGQRLSCIEGHAGTGKSYLLFALKKAYESEGYIVRAFGPDSATSSVLKEKGFETSENIYQFLFALHNEKRSIKKNKEIWILDEAGKLGNRPLLELLKSAEKHGAQLIFSGNSAQLPSVERGGMFKAFCQKFGAQYLVDIQRQKVDQQREMTQKLAYGDIGGALDRLAEMNGLKWEVTKEKAMEALILKWAQDRISFPNASNLIIAHSNAEVKTLNELVRIFRSERGELGEKEYLCNTNQGKVYVSVGDIIEFRKNDEMGVINGMQGVLVKASEHKFSVQVKDGQQVRTISFDPSEYNSFHLGYATTYHRSQGRTVDRAYVLHSKQLNKEKFYVGLTRHTRSAELFIAKTEISCPADLKCQLLKTTIRESTLDYSNPEEITRQNEQSQIKEKIEELKSSDSYMSQIKGSTLSMWSGIQNRANKFIERVQDHRPNKDFFNPQIDNNRVKGMVTEVEEKSIDIQELKEVSQQRQSIAQEESKAFVSKNYWKQLSEQSQTLLKEYYKANDQASALRTLVQTEAEAQNIDEKKTAHFSEWQKACGERNQKAFTVLQEIQRKELKQLFDSKRLEIIQERADRYEASQKDQKLDVDAKLKNNLEGLLYSLFPEGPSRKDSKSVRFGSKGSLAVTVQGSKMGSFFDHERKEGGGPLQLIQRTLNLSSADAKKWALNFLNAPQVELPSAYAFSKNRVEKEGEWISLKPQHDKPAPSLAALSKHLSASYEESARYCYQNEQKESLFYTLRLVDKNDASKKIVIPLSYGYWKGDHIEPRWSLKGYQSEQKTLYNLPLLQEHPKATVLIVEGEKTADAANKMLKDSNIVCLTWSGGAGAVSKTNWEPLFNKDVIIWPDNDQAGFKAGDQIVSELRKVGISSLKMVDREVLTKEFPQKWDLADPMPATKISIKDMLLQAQEKAIGLKKVNGSLMEKLKTYEVLWRVEERLRPNLEKEHGNRIWDINQAVWKEVNAIVSFNEKKNMGNEKSEALKILSYQSILYQARTGKEPSESYLNKTKEVISKIGFCDGDKLSQLIYSKSLTNLLEKGVTKDHQMIFTKAFEKEMGKIEDTLVEEDFGSNLRRKTELGEY